MTSGRLAAKLSIVFLFAAFTVQPAGSVELLSPADIDGNGVVDQNDIFLFSSHFDPTGHLVEDLGDRNGDNVTDKQDLDLMIRHWRQRSPEPVIGPTPLPGEGGTVKGSVMTVTREGVAIPVPDARVEVHAFEVIYATTTDAQGQFEIPNVPAGTHVIVAAKPGFYPDRRQVSVPAGGEVSIDLFLHPLRTDLGSLSGIVREVTPPACIDNGTPCVGPPIAGALVRLIPLAFSPPVDYDPSVGSGAPDYETIPGRPAPEQATRTDERGFYFFPDIPAGEYIVLVAAAGYEPAEQNAEVAEGGRTFVDFYLERVPTGVLFGKVTEATDSALAGNPIPGAAVHLYPILDIDPADPGIAPLPQPLYTARTDENGEYEFPPIPAGPYHVRVRAYGYETLESEISIPPFERVEADYQLKPLSIEFGAVDGTVHAEPLTPEGPITPLEGATVLLLSKPWILEGTAVAPGDPASIFGGLSAGSIIRRATTAADGSYRFDNIIPGDYVVIAKHPGFYPQRKPAQVLPAETTTVDFLLARWVEPEFGAVEGYVKEDPGMLTIVPPPIPGALVIIEPWNYIDPTRYLRSYPMSDTSWDGLVFPRRTLTDENGFYRFDDLPPGTYRLRVFAEGYAPAEKEAAVKPLTVTTVDFLLQRVLGEYGKVLGTVFEVSDPASGDLGLPVPVPGAKVTLYPVWSDLGNLFDDSTTAPAAPSPDDYAGSGILVTFTNDMGAYEFPQVPAGMYRIMAEKEGLEPQSLPIQVRPREIVVQDFYLSPAPPEPFGAVGGRVMAASTETNPTPWPIPGAYVYLIPTVSILPDGPLVGDFPPGTQMRITDAEGRYYFERVTPGGYTVVVYAIGYEPGVREVIVGPGDAIRVNFFLVPGGPIPPSRFSGHVLEAGTDPTFAPVVIPGATVTVVPDWPGDLMGPGMPERPIPLYEAVTDERGFFEFPELPAGEYFVHIRAAGYVELDARVSLPPGVEVRRDYYLRPLGAEPAVLEGFVREATSSTDIGGPIAGAEVVLVMMRVINGMDSMSPGMYRTFTDENGYYRFEGIEPTLYHVSVSAAGYEPFFGTVELLPGQELRQDYFLRPSIVRPGRVCGTVMSPTGPISGARVTIPLAGLVLAAETDDAGAYCIDSVPAGRHRVVAAMAGYIPQSIEVYVPNGGTATADFVLEPAPVPGTAAFAGLVVAATDGSAVPVEGAVVRLSLIYPPTFAPVIYGATTDAEGRFRIDDIFAPGVYDVFVAARDCGSIRDEVAVEAGDEIYREYTLACHIPGPAAMEGRVAADIPGWVGPILPPIAGAVVRLIPAFDPAPVPIYEATTDETGHYAIGGIQPGSYGVSVTAEGYLPAEDTVNFGPGETVIRNYDLAPVGVSPGSVSGRVIVNTTYRVVMPIPGARLTLSQPGGQVVASATSDAEGFFEMGDVPPGSYMLRAEAKDYYPENRPVSVLPGGNTDVVLRLLQFTTHVGEVSGVATWLIQGATLDGPEPAPIPVANQPVTLVSIEYSFSEDYPPILLEGKTNQGGEFRFPVVPAGRYNLTIGWSGSGSYTEEVGVPEGQSTYVPVEVPAPAAILAVLEGRVLSGNSTDMKGIGGALVRLVPAGVILPDIFPPPSFGLDAITDATGAYRIAKIPPGAYNAVVVAEAYNPGHAALGFRPGEVKRHNFFLEPTAPPPVPAAVLGTVSEYTGFLDVFIPIPDALVTLSGSAGTPRTALTGPGGEYVIPDVPAGSYRISAEKADYMMEQKDVTVPTGEEVWVNFSLHPANSPMRVGN